MRGNNSVNLKPLLEKQLEGHVQLKVVEQCGLYWQKRARMHAFVCKVQNVKQQDVWQATGEIHFF